MLDEFHFTEAVALTVNDRSKEITPLLRQLAYYVSSNPIPRLLAYYVSSNFILTNEVLRRLDAAFFACYASSIPHFCKMGILEMGIFGMGYYVNGSTRFWKNFKKVLSKG